MNKRMIAKVQKLCSKFNNDLQTLLDSSEMDEETYDSEIVQAAVQAQYDANNVTELNLKDN